MLDYTAHLRSDGALMAEAVARDLDAHVPTCPEWNVAKLTIHTGQHHRWVASAIRGRGTPPEMPGKPGLRGAELVDWFRSGWSDLADLLEGSNDDDPAWTWWTRQDVGFWRRRTALETLVHRWDAQNATGTPTSLDAELAADGVDEMLTVMVPDMDATYGGKPATVGLQATDAGAAWVLVLRPGEIPEVARSDDGLPDEVQAIAAATAHDLCLFLWGRLGPEILSLEGDPAIARAFAEWMAD